MNLEELNHWWTEKAVREDLTPATRRDLYASVKGDLERRQVQVLTGLRRVGKSTIFYQLIDDLIKDGVDPLHILYCSFDEPELQGRRIDELLREYSRLTDIDYKRERVYLFLDEAQKAVNWVADVKLIYDNLRNVKVLVSGSASLNISSEARRSLAGRSIYYELRPLSFGEFLRLKGVSFDMGRPLLYRELLEKEFNKFLIRPFPELIHEQNTDFIKNYIRGAIIEPIPLKDIPKEFGGVDILLIEKLVNIFLKDPGQYLRLDELAKELKRAKLTLYKAIFYLEFSMIIRRILNYRPSIRAASRKLARIYPYHPCLTLPFRVPEERFAENLVLFELNAEHYWREGEKEINFLKDSTPIEVKYKSKIRGEDLRWIKFFLKKYNAEKAYIITKNVEGKIDAIYLVPLWQFCLKGL